MPSKTITGKASIAYGAFIDANVIAKWLIFHSLLAQKKTTREKQEFIEQQKNSANKHSRKLHDSYLFIENMLSNNGDFQFYYSPLVLTEVFNVLFEKYVFEYMQRNMVPLAEIHKLREEKFPEGTYKEIYIENENLFKRLQKAVKISKESEEIFGIAGVFISEYGLRSHDAHLMAQAVYQNCKYFITCDGDLLEKFKTTSTNMKPAILAITPSQFTINNY